MYDNIQIINRLQITVYWEEKDICSSGNTAPVAKIGKAVELRHNYYDVEGGVAVRLESVSTEADGDTLP